MRLLAIALSSLILAGPLCGCITKAAARTVEAPGHIVGGLLGG